MDHKELWIQFLEAYKEKRLLWDRKDEYYHKQHKRNQAMEELLIAYRKMHKKATIEDVSKQLRNFKIAFFSQLKMLREKRARGEDYVPNVWFFDLLCFLSPETESYCFDTIKYYKSWCKRTDKHLTEKPRKRRKKSTSSSSQSANEEAHGERESPPMVFLPEMPTPPKQRIYNLLHKQERFIDTVTKTLCKKTEDWEVHGRSLGLQLNKLEEKQRRIAQKLISEIIFYGTMDKLSVDASLNVFNTNVRETETQDIEDREMGLHLSILN